jgi:hypothetical protein
MNRVHGLVDRRRSRSTMDRSKGVAVGSLELTLGGRSGEWELTVS